MFFRDVIGQEEIKQRLIQEVNEGRIPHAQLICGPEGVGKMPLAIAYARYISCTNRGETDACGTCPSCVKFNKLVHPDVHFVFPIVKSAKGKKEVCDDYIADWRPFVINHPYFNLNHWLGEMDAENSQALIYAKESDEILKKLTSNRLSARAFLIASTAFPRLAGKRSMSLPASSAFTSASPGWEFWVTPFIFMASVKHRPEKFSSRRNNPWMTGLEREAGMPVESIDLTARWETITAGMPASIRCW